VSVSRAVNYRGTTIKTYLLAYISVHNS